MRQSLRRSIVALGIFGVAGCGGGDQKLPEVPTTDNRPAEVKEADDLMARNVEKIKGRSR